LVIIYLRFRIAPQIHGVPFGPLSVFDHFRSRNRTFRLNLWLFPGAAVLAVVIAVLTVSGQSIKAATADPVESLKHE
jgi:hypothetical protein